MINMLCETGLSGTAVQSGPNRTGIDQTMHNNTSRTYARQSETPFVSSKVKQINHPTFCHF